MYSCLGNVQVIVALLKKYDIKDIVLSAGTRHTPLVYSVEHDDFFNCYSIVDERSASFFALGLIQEKQRPVAICCTSGTASANYVSAANEAFYQQLPLVILTADRNNYYKFQQEEQMIPQLNLFRDVCKYIANLPIARDEKDIWYCTRKVNEALMELDHREKGPVQINFQVENNYPVPNGIVNFDVSVLPDIKRSQRLSTSDSNENWVIWSNQLVSKKILIIYGQHGPLNEEQKQQIERFCKKFNCVISTDILSNLWVGNCYDTYTLMKIIDDTGMKQLCPDIVITMNGNSISNIKEKLFYVRGKFEHWHVSLEGKISDPFKCIPNIVECDPLDFFRRMNAFVSDNHMSTDYYNMFTEYYNNLIDQDVPQLRTIDFSAIYAVRSLMQRIPDNSLLHCANSNSIRLMAFFSSNPTINVYGNRGTHGIDGSMSAFIGQAHCSGKLSFLVIGDLSFFYDMNALWNQYIGNNIRIMVCNNSGGAIFHNFPNTKNVPTLDDHIAAEHHTSVREWVMARKFKYIGIRCSDEIDSKLEEFIDINSRQPIVMEVFTDKDIDTIEMNKMISNYQKDSIKSKLSRHLPETLKREIRKLK